MVREQGMRSEALGMRPKVKEPHASYLTLTPLFLDERISILIKFL